MTHETVLERLDDWIGGELPSPERAEMDLHLAGCAECRAEAEALRALLAGVAALPAEIVPANDLWGGIASRLEPHGASAATPAGMTGLRRIPRWALQAAAVVLLMIGTSAVTAVIVGQRKIEEFAVDAKLVDPSPPVTALAAFQRAEPEYRDAIGELEMVLRSKRARLAPETVRTLEANLRIIDQAIAQSRAALVRDPNSAEVAQMLSAAYDQKMNVLQQAVAL
jgi:anti-sigma factor RsiW